MATLTRINAFHRAVIRRHIQRQLGPSWYVLVTSDHPPPSSFDDNFNDDFESCVAYQFSADFNEDFATCLDTVYSLVKTSKHITVSLLSSPDLYYSRRILPGIDSYINR